MANRAKKTLPYGTYSCELCGSPTIIYTSEYSGEIRYRRCTNCANKIRTIVSARQQNGILVTEERVYPVGNNARV